MKHIALIAVLVVLLGACSAGPGEDIVLGDIESRLQSSFTEDIFEVVEFSRRGHQAYHGSGDQASGVIVYYKARLRFRENYELSSWSGYNLGSLLAILGATQAGVQGVNPDGNKAGDELQVYGLVTYEKRDDAWHNVMVSDLDVPDQQSDTSVFEPEIDTAEAKYFDGPVAWYDDYHHSLSELASRLVVASDRNIETRLRLDLQQALVKSQLRVLADQGALTLASGPESGGYFPIGERVALEFNEHQDRNLGAIATTGAEFNLALMHDGLALLALTQNDLASLAYNGEGMFEGRRQENLRALASLYPEAIQIIARAGAGIESLADLAGKQVNLGAPGTGGYINARQIVAAYGIDDSRFQQLDMAEASEQFRAGNLDALFVTTGYPSPFILGLGAQARLLPIAAGMRERLGQQYGFLPVEVPPNTYPGQGSAISTLAVTAMLVANESVPTATVKEVLDSLYASRDALSRRNLQGNFIVQSAALEGIHIPLHEGAREYFGAGQEPAAAK